MRVAKLMVMPGFFCTKSGMRGISQRVPKVGRMARRSRISSFTDIASSDKLLILDNISATPSA